MKIIAGLAKYIFTLYGSCALTRSDWIRGKGGLLAGYPEYFYTNQGLWTPAGQGSSKQQTSTLTGKNVVLAELK